MSVNALVTHDAAFQFLVPVARCVCGVSFGAGMRRRNEDGAFSTTGGDETEVAVGTSEGNEKVASGSDELQVVADAVRSLPSRIVKDLLSIEVCVRCILRLLGIRGHVYSSSLLSPSLLCSVLEESKPVDEHGTENRFKESESQESGNEALFCSICLGVLQFSYTEENGVLVRKDCGRDFSESIAQVIKSQGHDIDGFSIEISLPQIILENEHSVRLSMKKKYGSEIWFHEKFLTEHISVKDALKLSITNSLENFLAVKSGNNTFRIRLTYTHIKGSTIIPKLPGREHCHKRRKTGTSNALHAIDESQTNDVEHSETSKGEENPVTKRYLDGLQDEVFHEHFESPLEKVNQPCQLEFHCYRTPIYIGGRYLKYSRNVSQTKWIIDDERMGEASVEEIIGSNILPVCRGDSYRFHAAGREDIDVRMLGSGRPFLIEVQNARCLPSMVPIGGMEDRINNLEAKLVRVKNLKMLDNQGWALMREGEAEKQKQYAALVWISRPLKDEDLCLLSSVKDMQILQRTPVRVLHRRSPLDREKIIHWMKVERIVGSEQYFLLHLCTQAGTYIKEFVHGDLGRTHPSIGSILECRAEILQLDVTDVKMDCFN